MNGEKDDRAGLGRASDSEAMRMVLAFLCIMEPDKRAELIGLAEQHAREAAVVDGITHFYCSRHRGDMRLYVARAASSVRLSSCSW